jgi:hypothetical protein
LALRVSPIATQHDIVHHSVSAIKEFMKLYNKTIKKTPDKTRKFYILFTCLKLQMPYLLNFKKDLKANSLFLLLSSTRSQMAQRLCFASQPIRAKYL